MSTCIGPVVERECGFCQGKGTRLNTFTDPETVITCRLCNGSGVVSVDVAPFVQLGRATEHIMAVRTSMGLMRTESFKPRIGTPAYHVDAVEDALGELFQQLVVMLPEEHQRTESGDDQ